MQKGIRAGSFSDSHNRKDTDMKRKLMVIIAMLLVGLQLLSCGTNPPEPSQNTTESNRPPAGQHAGQHNRINRLHAGQHA